MAANSQDPAFVETAQMPEPVARPRSNRTGAPPLAPMCLSLGGHCRRKSLPPITQPYAARQDRALVGDNSCPPTPVHPE